MDIQRKIETYDISQIISNLPDTIRWRNHIEYQLLPYWDMPEALGTPIGNFPTYRKNDGSLIDESKLPPEITAALASSAGKEIINLDRDYIRAHGRQTYAYGVAYHVLGDKKYLEYAKAGVDYLKNAYFDGGVDSEGNKLIGVHSYYSKSSGKWEPEPAQIRSQDMAYALCGIGFYYYLTRDKDVLADILAIKNYIFHTYLDKDMDVFRWVLEKSPDGDTTDRIELVAQLDQIYGYMILLTPSLPEPHQTKWKNDLVHVAKIIIKQFYSTEYGMYWGAITNPQIKRVGTSHMDFGHSVKTMWLIYQIGKMTDDISLINFAKEHAIKIIDTAYIEETGSWANGFDENGAFKSDKEWWGLAELDQTTATISLVEPAYARYIVNTYDYWFKYMVDNTNGEIWHMVSAKDNKPMLEFPKIHSWKNSFHSFEHALVSYITTHQLKGEELELYYAFSDDFKAQLNEEATKRLIHPYLYEGKIVDIEDNGKVKFTYIR